MSAFDFQAQQERSRRASILLVLFFILLVMVINLVIGALVAVFVAADAPKPPGAIAVDPLTMLAAAGVAMAGIVGAASIRVATFGGDGARVARALGAEEVTEDTANPFKKRYLNVVEEMAIAAGLPRPRAFVVGREQGINAFAAGNDPGHAAIGVTHGALAKLNREELAGVVGHEMAHIANQDTRLNMRLMGMVFGLVALYTLGRGLVRSLVFIPRRRDNRTAVPALAIGAGLIVVGLLGVLAGRILQSAVSRRREFLADATGVQFTRNPLGLANALKKIGATSAGSRVENEHAEEARHMFFANATGSFGGLFATHPPLLDRIRALDPGFDPGTDPIWRRDDQTIIREVRQELAVWPRERESP